MYWPKYKPAIVIGGLVLFAGVVAIISVLIICLAPFKSRAAAGMFLSISRENEMNGLQKALRFFTNRYFYILFQFMSFQIMDSTFPE